MHPYKTLEQRAFWQNAVAGRTIDEIAGLSSPKFKISRKTNIATAGSCFAQQISRQLRQRGIRFSM